MLNVPSGEVDGVAQIVIDLEFDVPPTDEFTISEIFIRACIEQGLFS